MHACRSAQPGQLLQSGWAQRATSLPPSRLHQKAQLGPGGGAATAAATAVARLAHNARKSTVRGITSELSA